MYAVWHASDSLREAGPLVVTPNEADALLYAIGRVVQYGADIIVTLDDEPRWSIEADTKVADDAPYFPAIVTRR